MNRFEMKIHSAANVFPASHWLWKHVAICAALIAALLAFTPALWAQENATVNGTVTDSTGAVIPNATVNLTNTATGQVRSVTSNSVGAYRFPNVGIGTYNLEVTATGFAKFEKTGIVVNVAQTVEANAELNVGTQAQTVTVAAQSLQVQTETSEVSTLISGQQVARLSTNGRNIVQLAALGMGVANTLASFGGVNALTSANGLSFNGTRTTHNVYLLDGGELNDRGCGGCYMVLPSQDAIAEFKTLDSNYSPDYGIGSGGTITMVIKSGSRAFHGEIYEFNRNTAYNANDYFNKQAGRARPVFQLNEPGGNLGGPLYVPHVYNENKTRTFFFVNEEWRRLIQGSAPSVQNTVTANNFPTAGQALNYTPYVGSSNPPIPKVPNLPNNTAYTNLETSLGLTPGAAFPKNAAGQYVIPAQMIDQNAVMEVNAGTFPKPNLANGYQFTASPKQPTNVREDTVRIDHAINSKMQLMGHFVHDAVAPTFFPPLWQGSYPTVGTTMTNPSYTAVIKLTQTYSPNLLNETSVDYSGNKITLTPIPGPGASIAIPSGWTASSFFPVSQNAGKDMPAITFSGAPFGATWSESYFPWRNGYEGFEYRDDLSWIKGRHQFKFGFSWLHDYKNQQLQANTQGTANFSSSNVNFSGDAYIDFMLGLANTFTQLNYLAGKHWVNNNYGFYANDNWHVTSRFVMNLGFRYDGMPHAFERYNRFANFVPADYNTSLGYPLNSDGTLNPAYLTTFENSPFYLNGIRQAGVNGFPRGNVQNDLRSWQPRIGFAYDLFGNGKTVVRGGLGTFYERVQGNDVYNAALNPPFAYQPSATNVLFSNPHTSALTGQTTQQSFPSTMTTIKYHYPNPGTGMYSLGFQHELGPSIVAVLQYVGSDGWNQNNDRQINTLPLGDVAHRQLVATGKTNTNLWRTYPGFSSINQEENTTHFNYNSLQAGLRVENRHGATATFAYTWSHLIDINQNDLGGLTAPFNAKYDKGSDAGYDHRHMFNASYVYDLPFFKQQGNLAEREVLGGWSISGITQAQVGTPIVTSLTGVDTVGLGNGGNRPNLVSKVTYPKTQAHWFDKTAFATPLAAWNGSSTNGYGTAGKDSVVGPGLINWNLSLFKIIPLTPGEGAKLELRFESFNTFNHTNFTSVDLNSGDGNFGSVTADFAPRVLELGGKITF
ncbi:MAG TPA: carboxypeptidase-like regulatory domain-containing protein [Terracidiphilus sp.]|nr:carboxypeptidase-like regulatory domain-containing protein [Terracidiphilus sp.]